LGLSIARDFVALHRVLKTSCARLRNLIDSLLVFSRVESGRMDLSIESLDVAAVVQGIVEEFAWRAEEKNLVIAASGLDEPVFIESDKAILCLILVNLMDNAVKYTEQGEVRFSLTGQDGIVRIIVSDTGPGIPPERHVRIFEPFEQGEQIMHKYTPGVGVGLAIVRRMADMLGGSVCLESTEGVGSAFVLMLPLISADAIIRMSLYMVLTMEGHEVGTAANGEDAS
jgi:signal transduction histidine kinase